MRKEYYVIYWFCDFDKTSYIKYITDKEQKCKTKLKEFLKDSESYEYFMAKEKFILDVEGE